MAVQSARYGRLTPSICVRQGVQSEAGRYREQTVKRLLTWQKVVGVLSVVILGGFASTISDILFKPVVLAISDAMLDVATLGITSVRDGMYVEVAKGSYERAAVNLLLAWTSLVFVITFFTTAIALVVTKPGFRAHLREAIESGKQIEEPTLARARGLISILVVVNCLTAGFIMASGIRMIYVVRAANYLEQLERVVSLHNHGSEIDDPIAGRADRK